MTNNRHRYGFGNATTIRGVGIVLIVIVLAVTIFALSRHTVGRSTTISGMPTASSTATSATATPLPHVATLQNLLTPAQAWGNYAKQVVMSGNFGGHAMQDIFPDGSAFVEGKYADPDNTALSMIPIAHPTNGHVVYTTPQGASSVFARTDGRFVAWMSTMKVSGGPDAGLQFVGYIDLQTQRVTTLADGAKGSVSATWEAEMAVDHGYLLWAPLNGSQSSLAIINMVTGQSKIIAPNLSKTYVNEIQLSYPYVFYTNDSIPHIYDLTTDHDTVLSQIQLQTNELRVFALYGSTLFWEHGNSSVLVASGSTSVAVDEIDHADQTGAKLQHIAEYDASSVVSELVANDRLIAWGGGADTFAWDRVQHRFITFTAGDVAVDRVQHPLSASSANGGGLLLFMRGATFAFIPSIGTNLNYTFIDTTKLPVTAP